MDADHGAHAPRGTVAAAGSQSAMPHRPEAKSAKDWSDLDTRWDGRARLAAEWLQAETGVADIGCGLMTLEPFLPAATTYVPMDLVRRDGRTLVVDLARDRIPEVACSAAVMLGVLEYLDDIGFVLRQLPRFPKAVISYNHYALNDVLWALGLRRRRVDWARRYSRGGFRRAMIDAGLRITRERRVRHGERLYEVRPAGTGPAATDQPADVQAGGVQAASVQPGRAGYAVSAPSAVGR
jgi:hypothetical protein